MSKAREKLPSTTGGLEKTSTLRETTEMKVCIPITLKESKPRRERRKKEQYIHSETPSLKTLQSDQLEILMGSEITLVTFAV